MAPELRLYSRDEVSKHNTGDDCWIVMDSKVYDVSKFLNEHPGGGEVIRELGGQDATVAFQDVGHSKDAKEMAAQYLIGELKTEDKPAAPAKNTGKTADNGCGCSLKDILTSPTWTNFLIPTAIGITVYALYKGAMKTLAY